MDKLDAMRQFVRVAELGSFAAAAAQLGVARSAVTRQVAQLESHLGSKLMLRSTRRLTLTAAGTAYLEKCRVILNLVEAAETDIAAESLTPRGTIRIALPLSFGLSRLAPLLLDFAERYPEVGLDMDYSDRRLKLIDEGIDLAVRITRRLEPGDIARRLGSARMCLVAAPDYLARHGSPRQPQDLANHECLGYTAGGGPLPWQFDVAGQMYSFTPQGRINAGNGDVLNAAVIRGMGIACQPDFIVAPALAAGQVQSLLDDFPQPELGIYALLPSNRHIPHRVRVLLDFLAAALGGV
ncbi:MAG: hypothetical protein RIR00_2112 [Pseudomonadota bacterium]|jgi:DNA-binding transcriptional LysR family regulator